MMIVKEGCAWEGKGSSATVGPGAQGSPERGLWAELLLGKLTQLALSSGI